MALLLTEEQRMLRDSALAYLADNAPVAALRRLRDADDAIGFSPALWRGFAAMGFAGVLVPERHGGLGLGFVEAGIVLEAVGRNLTATPFAASGVVGATLLAACAGEAQQQAWLGPIASGEKVVALAVDETARHRPDAIALRARAVDGGWRLDGAKRFVPEGHAADALIVAARSAGDPGDAGGISLFLMPAGTPGLQVERVAMVDSRPCARLRFDDVALDASALLGRADHGAKPLQVALDAGRAVQAAELLGIADEVFARTLGFLKERRQFDRPIGEFQALQHRAAILYTEIEIARAAVLHALQRLDADRDVGEATQRAVSVAKAKAGAAATLAVQEGVQMHGGMGMTDAYDIGLFMKRARVLQELYGDAGFHADRLARMRGY